LSSVIYLIAHDVVRHFSTATCLYLIHPTEKGDVFLKIVPPVFMREPQITAKLAEWGITKLPEILAVEQERGFLLTKDMGGCNLTDCLTVEKLEAVVRVFAEFQFAAVDFVNLQAPSPFYDCRICVVQEKIDTLFDEAPALLDDSPYALSAEEKSRLRQKLPEWKQLCEEIQQVPLPDTIDHGDLRPGNIRVVNDGLILYDWAWSAITHPFIGVVGLLRIVRRWLCENDRRFLRDAYLEAWTEYASNQELRCIFDLVTKILALVGVAADGKWLRAIHRALRGNSPSATSADAWTLRWRQYHHSKVVRRLFSG
jgi:hypothetical protein